MKSGQEALKSSPSDFEERTDALEEWTYVLEAKTLILKRSAPQT